MGHIYAPAGYRETPYLAHNDRRIPEAVGLGGLTQVSHLAVGPTFE